MGYKNQIQKKPSLIYKKYLELNEKIAQQFCYVYGYTYSSSSWVNKSDGVYELDELVLVQVVDMVLCLDLKIPKLTFTEWYHDHWNVMDKNIKRLAFKPFLISRGWLIPKYM